MNLAANQYSKQQTNQVHSAKFKQARIVSPLLNITTPRVTYEKYASSGGRIDTTSVDVSVLFPGKTLPSI